MNPTFEFSTELYLWKPESTWVFAMVPLDVSDEINEIVPDRRGFGSVRVEVGVGATAWQTSVFPDSASGCFVLPVKKAVRAAEAIDVGDEIAIELTVIVE